LGFITKAILDIFSGNSLSRISQFDARFQSSEAIYITYHHLIEEKGTEFSSLEMVHVSNIDQTGRCLLFISCKKDVWLSLSKIAIYSNIVLSVHSFVTG
jgi:hypothetical protein